MVSKVSHESRPLENSSTNSSVLSVAALSLLTFVNSAISNDNVATKPEDATPPAARALLEPAIAETPQQETDPVKQNIIEATFTSAVHNLANSAQTASLEAASFTSIVPTLQRPERPVFLFGGGALSPLALEVFGKWSNGDVLVCLWASEVPDVYFKSIKEGLIKGGAKSVTRMPDLEVAIEAMKNTDRGILDENDPRVLFKQSSALFFSGGDQIRLKHRLMQAGLEKYIHDWIVQHNAPVAGTSAGTAIMSRFMIGGTKIPSDESWPGQSFVQLEHSFVAEGIGLLKNCTTDQHFDKRNRLGRLLEALVNAPEEVTWAIGVDESAAATVTEGRFVDVIGPGNATIILRKADGSCEVPVVISLGERFDLQQRTVIKTGITPETAQEFEKYVLSTRKDSQFSVQR